MPLLKTARVPRSLAIAALLCGAAWMGARPAAAEVDVDLRAGVYMDAEAFAVGAGLLSPLGSHNWFFNPNLEIAFGDNANMVSLNGDIHYDFAGSSSMSMWLGAGPALLVRDPDGGSSDTNLGLNVFTGITGTRGSVRPFAQLKGVVSDNSEVVLQGGIRF
jgi:hypothetical protein